MEKRLINLGSLKSWGGCRLRNRFSEVQAPGFSFINYSHRKRPCSPVADAATLLHLTGDNEEGISYI